MNKKKHRDGELPEWPLLVMVLGLALLSFIVFYVVVIRAHPF